MTKRPLHITNGLSLTHRLDDLGMDGDVLTWHEMLCEGPTTERIDSPQFLDLRKAFLNTYYDVEIDEYEFKNELHMLSDTQAYSEIVLWFEYDLFCHINLVAVISLLQQKNIDLPYRLVCSGRIKGEKDLKGLSELTDSQLLEHFKNGVYLNEEDIEIATTVWSLYCGKNHNLLKPYITTTSSFEYLNSCLKAHLKRFPDSKTGLGRLESHILETIDGQDIKSKHHLLGYILNYQGYYGFGDLQIRRMIDHLDRFYDEDSTGIRLNREGHEVLVGTYNAAKALNNTMTYGGVNRLEYQFNIEQNKLIKTVINAN